MGEDIPRLRELWQGPLVVRGILRPDDARRAVAEGVGHRRLKKPWRKLPRRHIPALAPRLPEVVAAVGDEIESSSTAGSYGAAST